MKPKVGELWEVSDGEYNAAALVMGRVIWAVCPAVLVVWVDTPQKTYEGILSPCRASYLIRRIQEA